MEGKQANRRGGAGFGERVGIDLTSLRTRWIGAFTVAGIVLAMGWVLAGQRADARLERTRVQGRLEAVARQLAEGVDGDAERIALDTTGAEHELVVLGATAHLLAAEGAPAAGADGLVAEIPVLDSFGNVVRQLRVETAASIPVGRWILSTLLRVLIAGGILYGTRRAVAAAVNAHCDHLENLAEGRPDLVEGAFVSREVASVARLVAEMQGVEFDDEEEEGSEAPAESAAAAAMPEPPSLVRDANGRRGAAPATSHAPASAASAPGPEVREYSPAELIPDVLSGYRPKAQRLGIELKHTIGERVPERVEGRPRAAAEALRALVETAFESIQRRPANAPEPKSIHLRVSRPFERNDLRFEVRDTGKGIAFADQNALRSELSLSYVDPDANASRLQKASGLVATMGGELDFESQPGFGTRFWFTARASEGMTVGGV